MDEKWLSPSEAAFELGVTVQSIYRWIAQGHLAAFSRQCGERVRFRIKRSDVLSVFKQHKPEQNE